MGILQGHTHLRRSNTGTTNDGINYPHTMDTAHAVSRTSRKSAVDESENVPLTLFNLNKRRSPMKEIPANSRNAVRMHLLAKYDLAAGLVLRIADHAGQSCAPNVPAWFTPQFS